MQQKAHVAYLNKNVCRLTTADRPFAIYDRKRYASNTLFTGLSDLLLNLG